MLLRNGCGDVFWFTKKLCGSLKRVFYVNDKKKKIEGAENFFGAVYKYVNISMDVFVLGS